MPTLPDYPEISHIKHESPGFLHRSRQFPFFQIKLTFEPSVEFSRNFSKIQIFFCDFEVHITVLSGIFPRALYIYFIIDIDCYLVLHLRLCIMFWPTPTFWFESCVPGVKWVDIGGEGTGGTAKRPVSSIQTVPGI